MRTPIVMLAVAAALAGCRHSDSQASLVDRDTGRVEQLGPNDMVITTRDSAMEMGVIGDHIAMRLSAKSLAKVREETDTAKVEGSGFGASIEKVVKKSVAGALQKQVDIPLSDVRDVRYENGRLVFDWLSKPRIAPENTKANGNDLLASFSAEDSQRFVAAVRAHKASPSGR